ncbi:ribonuclease H-like domain-containing protein [Rhizophagus irregularis DAOM 181602=DAOM 197198]|nr:ribonuclease H-like domain-containing protein [Rhizophagus irregularis DAOM 181602=DAOM 197198]
MSARSIITVCKNCSIIENPWFINLIKTLQPGYDPPLRQVLSGTLLESEISRVNIRIMNELSADNNFTIGKHLSNVIEEVINKVEAKKFVAIVSDNGSNVAAAHEVKYIVRCVNILTKYFKNSTLGSLWLNEAIKSKNIEGGGLKTYVKTRWMTVYKCVHSVWRLKDALQHIY